LRAGPPSLASALLAVLSGPAAPAAAETAQEPPPNIVLMLADNLGIGEVGVYGGNRGVPTPRLDALARLLHGCRGPLVPLGTPDPYEPKR
jgi:hypothetical protein